jgi:hypothetical protein
MYKLKKHQIEKSKELNEILLDYKIAYLAGEVRSGKTLTALEAARLYGASKVIVITKKKAIPSILSDYKNFGFDYEIVVINYESIHKLEDYNCDLVIYDESHSLSGFPKPSVRTKLCKKLFFNVPCILMTGTSAVESYSQYYHQFFVSAYSPFSRYKNFYKWVKDFVEVVEMKLPTHTVKDYSKANVEKIDKILKPYMVVMTQKDAGFEVNINENYLTVETPTPIKGLVKKLLKDKVIKGSAGYIFGDTPAKLQSKVHQLYNGHCIIEDENGETSNVILDTYKVDFIRERFKDDKIVIMYYYQNELKMIESVFGEAVTTNIDEFNTTDKSFALQQSSSEGMNLSKAKYLVYLNLGFSGKNYIQSRDRMTVQSRKENNIYFICESDGITEKILKAVTKKKNFNSRIFKQSYGI